jgi:hypothetical protein
MLQTLAGEFSKEKQLQLIAIIHDMFGGLKEIISMPSIQSAKASAPVAPTKKGLWPF